MLTMQLENKYEIKDLVWDLTFVRVLINKFKGHMSILSQETRVYWAMNWAWSIQLFQIQMAVDQESAN